MGFWIWESSKSFSISWGSKFLTVEFAECYISFEMINLTKLSTLLISSKFSSQPIGIRKKHISTFSHKIHKINNYRNKNFKKWESFW